MEQYSDSLIAHRSASNVIINTNEWSHSSMGGITEKRQNITINNGDGKMMPLFWEKINDYL